jgi:hypothetical protein
MGDLGKPQEARGTAERGKNWMFQMDNTLTIGQSNQFLAGM